MALSYADVQRYSQALRAITDRAKGEMAAAVADSVFDSSNPSASARAAAAKVAQRHIDTARELGAQWYEYAAEAADESVDPAIMEEYDYDGLYARVGGLSDSFTSGEITFDDFDRKLQEIIEDEIRNAARQEVIYNLDRDARADRRAGRRERAGYARVPVGETCAWCYMLASLGYYYRSYESAGGIDPDHYHLHCDCVVVPYSGPDAIEGYDDYDRYLEMYERARDAYRSGDYSEETAERIDKARDRHDMLRAEGSVTQKWMDYNAVLILMREQNGLKH